MNEAAITYRVGVARFTAHLFDVELRLLHPKAKQDFFLASWIPGSYLIREFCKHLQDVRAEQARLPLAVVQVTKDHWQVECDPALPLVLSYSIYAFDTSVRTAFLSEQRAFFNATSLLLRAPSHEALPHHLCVDTPSDPRQESWQMVTSLKAVGNHALNSKGFGTYWAESFDELADSPVEMGCFEALSFDVVGVLHRLVVSGAPNSTWDATRLVNDVQKICQTVAGFWQGEGVAPPFDHYIFLLNCVASDRGGLEHRASTALLTSRNSLPQQQPSGHATKPPEGYLDLLGLFSHEYFHAWCVKRLRPDSFASYDYQSENYTELLWFFEGFTSYYDDLLVLRAGLMDVAAYVRLLNKSINQVRQSPGQYVQSVAKASFDTWVKFYRTDENTPNSTISYYTKGALVALCLDLTLRSSEAGKSGASLDHVMRLLWSRHVLQGGTGIITEQDILSALSLVGGRSFAAEIEEWAHGTQDLPLESLLLQHGVGILEEPSQWMQVLGIRSENKTDYLYIKNVLRQSAAEAAGFCPSDEWLGVRVGVGDGAHMWRITSIEEAAFFVGAATSFQALVSRDQRILTLDVTLSQAIVKTWRLVIVNEALARKWLFNTAT